MSDPRPIKVLVVDDDQNLLFLTASFLGLSGTLLVETADAPNKALIALELGTYDAVVCDYDMPMMNGIEVLKKIRERSDVPFILFTGKGREDVVIDALNNGADFYLQKGADPASLFRELEHMIVQATDRRRYKDQLQESNEEMAGALEELRSTEESLVQQNRELEAKENDLLESRENYRSLFDHMLVGCAVHEALCGPDGRMIDYRFIDMNPAFEKMTGLGRDAILGRTVREVLPGIEEYWFERYGNVVATGDPIHYENFAQALGKHYEVVAFRNRPGQFAVTVMDVSDRKLQEDRSRRVIEDMNVTLEELRAAQEELMDRNRDLKAKDQELEQSRVQYHQLFKEMALASVIFEVIEGGDGVDAELRYLDVNPAFENLTALKRDQVIGRSIRDVFPDLDERSMAWMLSVARTGLAESSLPYSPRPGVMFEVSAYRPQPGKLALSFSDVSMRMRAEEERRRSESMVRSILNASPDGITVTDEDGKITYCSPRAVHLLGADDVTEVLGHRVQEWLAPHEIERAKGDISELEKGAIKDHDHHYAVLRKDGSAVIVEINSAHLLGPDGRKCGVVATLRDATERRRLEIAMKRANQKLNLLSSITRHDIMNQLTVLQGYIEMARNMSEPEDIGRCISKMDGAADNISRQIAFTREYQYIGVNAPVWCEPSRIWENVGALLAPSGVAIKCCCEGIEVFADPLFDKVLYNMIENSLRHGGKVTEIALSCRKTEGGLELIVEDDGTGIEPGDKYRIFVKGFGKGTGLGLFLAKEVLAITGATIQETGTFGQGARFEIFFPDGEWRPT